MEWKTAIKIKLTQEGTKTAVFGRRSDGVDESRRRRKRRRKRRRRRICHRLPRLGRRRGIGERRNDTTVGAYEILYFGAALSRPSFGASSSVSSPISTPQLRVATLSGEPSAELSAVNTASGGRTSLQSPANLALTLRALRRRSGS
jgi:hypothetical protein